MLEDAGERDFLGCFETALGMLYSPASLRRALAVLDRALTHARTAGQTVVESWALMTICFAHLYGRDIGEAERRADELAILGQSRRDEEATSYAHIVNARVVLARGDVAGARKRFADAVALASAHSVAWARAIALCGLASATLADGDELVARAIIEEALFFCVGTGYLGIDSLCGALALLLVKAGEKDRAVRVFDAVAAGTETASDMSATTTDPSGALRRATREARALLGDPLPPEPPISDFDSVLRAALGDRRQLV
ncbi:MAG TPA: hypothetical protein VK461_14575 [Acidimicrobiales bacterium]|nr:hypothetical protein [Acidimicrobiales bacterium]